MHHMLLWMTSLTRQPEQGTRRSAHRFLHKLTHDMPNSTGHPESILWLTVCVHCSHTSRHHFVAPPERRPGSDAPCI
eukprot:1062795-Pelagomonas_calceolata.AAC.7